MTNEEMLDAILAQIETIRADGSMALPKWCRMPSGLFDYVLGTTDDGLHTPIILRVQWHQDGISMLIRVFDTIFWQRQWLFTETLETPR